MTVVLATGGRSFLDASRVWSTLDLLDAQMPGGVTKLIVGDAKGADAACLEWALHNGVTVTRVRADWGLHGRGAGPRRNQFMVDQAPLGTVVVAFPGGRGTADCVRRAETAGFQVVRAD